MTAQLIVLTQRSLSLSLSLLILQDAFSVVQKFSTESTLNVTIYPIHGLCVRLWAPKDEDGIHWGLKWEPD